MIPLGEAKTIFMGLESSGKSLAVAMVVTDIAWRNKKWKEETGVVRPIVSNMKFSQSFHDLVETEYGLKIIYWEKLEELIEYEQCDVICDEVGNYLDATKWQNLSSDVKKWLTQGAKCGIEFYGTSQDFAQVDKSFRRLTNQLFDIKKLIGSPRPSNTKPPIKRIWGVCLMLEVSAKNYKEDSKEIKASLMQLPRIFYIKKKYCDIYDTTQKIKKDNKLFMRHMDVFCSDPNCTYHTIKHI